MFRHPRPLLCCGGLTHPLGEDGVMALVGYVVARSISLVTGPQRDFVDVFAVVERAVKTSGSFRPRLTAPPADEWSRVQISIIRSSVAAPVRLRICRVSEYPIKLLWTFTEGSYLRCRKCRRASIDHHRRGNQSRNSVSWHCA